MAARRLAASLLLLATTIVAGCANPNFHGIESASTNGPPPEPSATPEVAVVDPKPAASWLSGNSNTGAARYSLSRSQPSASAIGSVVVTNPVAPRTLDLTLRPDDIWDRIRIGFGVPNLDSPLVAEQQAWYLSHPDYLRRAVDRSSHYLYHVVEELNKRGMPTELALLPFVESAYNPMAYSKAHASGMWQFVPGTGKTYNLKQDWWRDDRRDVLASTDAALTYLQTIYEMHGDWYLALASYNWGENAVKRAIDRNEAAGLPTDYMSLQMPDETRNYVPKLQALKNIIANPEAFGVTLPRIDNVPYFVAIDRDRDIDVKTAARLANMSLDEFKALNPSFNRPVIRASTNSSLLVPADRAAAFRTGLDSGEPLATWQAHTVVGRETVEKIAARYGMTVAALREVNGLGPRARVRAGQGLLVQKQGPADVSLRFASFHPPEDVDDAPASAPVRSYDVRRGDSLASVAARFGVSTASLRAANRLRSDRVAAGQRLEIPIKADAAAGLAPAALVRGAHAPARSAAATARSAPTVASAPSPHRPAAAAPRVVPVAARSGGRTSPSHAGGSSDAPKRTRALKR